MIVSLSLFLQMTRKDKDGRVEVGPPELLDQRLEALGDLAITAHWGYNDRQRTFQEWMAQLKTVRLGAEDMVREVRERVGYQLTRRILAQQPSTLPPGYTM